MVSTIFVFPSFSVLKERLNDTTSPVSLSVTVMLVVSSVRFSSKTSSSTNTSLSGRRSIASWLTSITYSTTFFSPLTAFPTLCSSLLVIVTVADFVFLPTVTLLVKEILSPSTVTPFPEPVGSVVIFVSYVITARTFPVSAGTVIVSFLVDESKEAVIAVSFGLFSSFSLYSMHFADPST